MCRRTKTIYESHYAQCGPCFVWCWGLPEVGLLLHYELGASVCALSARPCGAVLANWSHVCPAVFVQFVDEVFTFQ